MSLKGRFVLMAVGIAVLTTICVSAAFIVSLQAESERQVMAVRQTLTQDVERELKVETETAISLIKTVYDRQQKGELTEEQARKEAADMVRNLRYDDGKGYFWVDTYDGVNVVLLGRDTEGKSRIDLTDPSGKHFIKEMIENGRKDGGGYTDLMFAKPNETTPLPKRNYTASFAPYQWVLGTGVWIDYIDNRVAEEQAAADEAFKSTLINTLLINIVLLAIFSGVGLLAAKSIVGPLHIVTTRLGIMAEGDLREDHSLEEVFHRSDEIGEMSRALHTLQTHVSEMMRQIIESSQQVAASSQQLTNSSEQSAEVSGTVADSIVNVAGSCSEQFTEVENASTNIESLSDSMERFKKTIEHAGKVVAEAKGQADSGEQAVTGAVRQMELIEQSVSQSAQVIEELGKESDKIGTIVDAISEIAEQTNLLALNAAIEAARAGEHGRGFAVVADEVRKLAEQSSSSAGEISNLIGSIQDKARNAVSVMQDGVSQVQNGVGAVNGAGNSFKDIASMVEQVVDETAEMERTVISLANNTSTIYAAVNKISEMSRNVAGEAESVSAATEEQTATMNEIASASRRLTEMANGMESAVEKFKI
ncbi:methyl-accepting chemotaxis sensory transducer with Cache sensor [Selenomonas ruminantium]|uniref:Methyl-accepting chemotaxis sensory transducer with Cache sensor n=1 Tax=Selenomonas ruminantium TaxID=971 RepID=A0A1M6QZA1_SELRU|nr:methyl-accepting chemotaxis protein [Selenomonas ruminantium]SHK25397.1 methyl-accepting chemotaxis sensory transducer with Cache sensor [Selenomonas ruminantium]